MTEQEYECELVCTPVVPEEDKITSPLKGAKMPAYTNGDEAEKAVESGEAIRIEFDRVQEIEIDEER